MIGLSNVLFAGTGSFGERAATAGIVTLEGMAVIFTVLALLWGIIEILHRAVSRPAKKKKETVPAAETPEAPAPVTDDGAVVAAIVAAISALRAEEGNTGAFRVVNFRRASGKSQNRF